eukprot:3934455-Rhodomonas_salina.1
MSDEGSATARLAPHEVVEIYCARPARSPHDKTFVPSSRLVQIIATKFNIGSKTVRNIWNRRQWRNVTKHLWSDDERAAEMSIADRSIIPAQTRKVGRPKRVMDNLQAQGSQSVASAVIPSEHREETQERGTTAVEVTTERSFAFPSSSLFIPAPGYTTTHLNAAEARQDPDQAAMATQQDFSGIKIKTHKWAEQILPNIAAGEWGNMLKIKPTAMEAELPVPVQRTHDATAVAVAANTLEQLAASGTLEFELECEIGEEDPVDPFARDSRELLQALAQLYATQAQR